MADSWIPMAKLNEYCQKRKLKLEYKDVSVSGPPHDRIFTVMVVIEKQEYTPDTGKSKKQARSRAAKLAWDAIQREEEAHPTSPLQQLQPSPCPSSPPPQPLLSVISSPDVTSSLSTYISLLNEYGSKNKVSVRYPLKDKIGEDHKPNFLCTCEIDGKIYGEGMGQNKQTAKSIAAKQAYEKLMTQPVVEPEQGAASLDMSLCNSKETSEVASMNGVDSDLTPKGINDKLAAKIDDVQVSSSTMENRRDPAVKPKRKDTLLAPTFSKLTQRGITIDTRFLKDFEDIEKIGCGGFGRVFKAKHAIDKRLRAVKQVKLSFEEKEAVQREVEVLAKLDHENIVRYYGCWVGKDSFELEDSMCENSSPCDCLFIELEFCEKGTLADWMEQKRGTTKSKSDSLMKFQQIVEGVAYIHSQNLIHRDLKPLNILISKEDKIKISDFGLVTSYVDDPSVQRTENRGTKIYMAPEQAGKNYGKEVDIFPLGLILFEMLYIFETNSERSREWANIRKCIFPQTFDKKFPVEAPLIKKMLSEEPYKRPLATEILKYFHQGKQNGLHTC